MLEEVIACFLSLFSALTLDAPRLSSEMNDNTSLSEHSTRCIWEDRIHREYVSFEEENLPPETEYYIQLGYQLRNKPTYIESLLRSLKANVTITLAVLPLVLIGMALIYFDLRTADLCSEWQALNYTLSFDVERIRFIGYGVEKIIFYHSFPLTWIVLFGWNEFKRHYSSTVLVCQLACLLDTLYLSFLLLYGVDDSGPIKTHMALWRTSEIIEPERTFALVYFIRATFITLYRIMQADFENTWLFVGLSLLSGLSSLLKTATVGIREKVWARVIRFLNRTCCTRFHHLPGNTPHHKRLKADTEIQNILFENNSLIISQSYIVLYRITTVAHKCNTVSNRLREIQIAYAKFKSLTRNSNRLREIQIAYAKFKSLTRNSNCLREIQILTRNSNSHAKFKLLTRNSNCLRVLNSLCFTFYQFY